MTRREIMKRLKLSYDCSKKENSSSDVVITYCDTKYRVLIIKVSTSTQVTINSKIVWELKKGKLDGIRFVAVDSVLLNLKTFMESKNKIIIFTNKPYKVLKVLNESEVKDISNDSNVYDVNFVHDLAKIRKVLLI